jgi:type VI secretion system protein ImpC
MLETVTDIDDLDLLDRPAVAAKPAAEADPPPDAWLATLARLVLAGGAGAATTPRRVVEALVAGIDTAIAGQLDAILHAADFQRIEATWRGLYMLVRGADKDAGVKVKLLNISKRELGRVLRKFHGVAWTDSPIFRRIYEDEFGQFGGEPYGLLIGDYAFDQQPDDVAMLSEIAMVAAAAHAPFIAAASPHLLQMDSWAEIANPRDLTRLFATPEYIPWRALRDQEDTRYIGLCLPRFLLRLPYGAATDPQDAFVFEEVTEGADTSRLLWGNPAFAFGANVIAAFVAYGWCVRIRGIDRGGVVEGLPVLHHPTADGDVDRRTVTEICLSERRDAELATSGLIPLVHRKNSDVAAFISAPSLHKPRVYEDPDATANAQLSARLPYLFACCRFAHYLKAMVRDKVGATMSRGQLTSWLQGWLLSYVDGAPMTSSEDFKATHPLADARVVLQDRADQPGMYEAKVSLRPHYQLEGLSVVLRLVARVEPGRGDAA